MAVTSLVVTSAGTTLSVASAPPPTYDQTGFNSLTFVPVGEITDLGEFGKMYNLVTHMPLGSRLTIKRKGAYNSGTVQIVLGRVPSDAGQAALIAGRDSDVSRSIKVVLQTGTTIYFTAQVMQYTTKVGNVDTITQSTVKLEIDNDVLEF